MITTYTNGLFCTPALRTLHERKALRCPKNFVDDDNDGDDNNNDRSNDCT